MNASSSDDQLTCSCDGGFTEAANGSCGQCLAGTYSEITPSRWYRFTVLKNSHVWDTPGIGEIRFFNTSTLKRMPIPIASMSNDGGANPGSLKYLNDGNTDLTNFNKHWIDINYKKNISYTSTIVFNFDTPVSITSYEWFTTEFTTRYPVSWRFEKFHTPSGQWIELHYVQRWTGVLANYIIRVARLYFHAWHAPCTPHHRRQAQQQKHALVRPGMRGRVASPASHVQQTHLVLALECKTVQHVPVTQLHAKIRLRTQRVYVVLDTPA
jgi:hypothetical protein